MMKVTAFFSQTEFYMGAHCGLQCAFCDASTLDFQSIKDSIVSGVFFDRYSRSEWVNVIGCLPSEYETLSFLLTFLKSEGIRIRFWNQGVVDMGMLESIVDRCDELMLYCPSVDERIYQDIAVDSTFEEFLDLVQFLKDGTVSFGLYTPVIVEYIGDLPDIHEFAREHGLRWLLHYVPSDLNSDQCDSVNRYYNIQGVDVFKVKGKQDQRCIGVPFPQFKSVFAHAKNTVLNFLAKTR